MTAAHDDVDRDHLSRLLERRLELLDEVERLEAEQEDLGGGILKAFVPAVLFAALAPLFWSPPLWVMLCGPLLLLGFGFAYLLKTVDVRASRAAWRRIQRLKRELAYLDSIARLERWEPRDSIDVAALEEIQRIVEEDVEG